MTPPPPTGEGNGAKRRRRESRALLDGILSEKLKRAS